MDMTIHFIYTLLQDNVGWLITVIIIYFNIKNTNNRIDNVEDNLKNMFNNGVREDIRQLKQYQEESRLMYEAYGRDIERIKATCEERKRLLERVDA